MHVLLCIFITTTQWPKSRRKQWRGGRAAGFFFSPLVHSADAQPWQVAEGVSSCSRTTYGINVVSSCKFPAYIRRYEQVHLVSVPLECCTQRYQSELNDISLQIYVPVDYLALLQRLQAGFADLGHRAEQTILGGQALLALRIESRILHETVDEHTQVVLHEVSLHLRRSITGDPK